MLGFSWGEWGLVLVVGLLVLKPEDLPDVMRKGAKLVRSARSMADEVTAPFKDIVRTVEEETAPLRKIQGDDGKWYDTYMAEQKPQPQLEPTPQIKNSPDHERI